jgi:uncharacterized protein (TIGR02270 family)
VSTPVAPETQPAPLAPPAGGSAPASATPAPKLSYIPEILEEHYEEIQFLWAIRRNALCSPRFTLRELAKFAERITAHLQGMLAVGEKMRDLVEPGLAAEDRNIAFAAAFSLLNLSSSSTTQLVLDEFASAKGPALDGIREAFCHAAPVNSLPTLDWHANNSPPPTAAAALEALTWRSSTPPPIDRARACLSAESASARASAWRVLAALGKTADPKDYSAAMRDDEASVRTEAVWAAVWACVPGILVLARKAAERVDPMNIELYRLLATLGTRDDGQLVTNLVSDPGLGPAAARFALIGAYGHPAHVDFLIAEMRSDDPETAFAAGVAFTKMLGTDIASDRRSELPPTEPTGDPQIDAEFVEDVMLPDADAAQRVWAAARDRLAGAEKICCGADVSRGAIAEQLATFDLQSRWYMAARNRYYGVAGPSPLDLARFPQRR